MRLLFDNGTPAPLRHHLGDHLIQTAARLGWATLTNGELLDRAEQDGYEILVTTDRNMQYQQNLSRRRISIVVLTNPRWPYTEGDIQAIIHTIDAIQPGEFREVPIQGRNQT